MRRPLVPFVLGVLVFAGCQDPPGHAPLHPGGAGRGERARWVDGGLKWDADAEVRFTGSGFEITNRDRCDWWRVTLSIDGSLYRDAGPTFSVAVGRMRAGETYTAPAELFHDATGDAYDPDASHPRRFLIVAQDAPGHRGVPGGCELTWRTSE
jgi:hypothetical protein